MQVRRGTTSPPALENDETQSYGVEGGVCARLDNLRQEDQYESEGVEHQGDKRGAIFGREGRSE
eukprot:1333257-Amorphochlora_amoeboformis.AAC.2